MNSSLESKEAIQDTAKYDLALVIPTYNEKNNVDNLLNSLTRILKGVNWQLVIVDDNSPDGTADYIQSKLPYKSLNVKVIKKLDKPSLASSVIAGIKQANAHYYAVMDADLQHDEKCLDEMYRQITSSQENLVIASRFLPESDISRFSRLRQLLSRLSNKIALKRLKLDLTDPMSGFFMIDRKSILAVIDQLELKGYKVLLNILLCSNNQLITKEVPYSFRPRLKGKSKLTFSIFIDSLSLLIRK